MQPSKPWRIIFHWCPLNQVIRCPTSLKFRKAWWNLVRKFLAPFKIIPCHKLLNHFFLIAWIGFLFFPLFVLSRRWNEVVLPFNFVSWGPSIFLQLVFFFSKNTSLLLIIRCSFSFDSLLEKFLFFFKLPKFLSYLFVELTQRAKNL